MIYIYRGASTFNELLYNFDGLYVRTGGSSFFGEIVFTVKGNSIYRGQGTWGTPAYTIDGNYIRRGQGFWSDVAFNIDGCYIRNGASSWSGEIMYCLES